MRESVINAGSVEAAIGAAGNGYVRLVIGEAVSDQQIREFEGIWHRETLPALLGEPGFVGGRMIVEESGRMVVCQTSWATRGDCLRYHSSRAYRQFVVKTQHLLIGNFVVKLFRVSAETPAPEAEGGAL